MSALPLKTYVRQKPPEQPDSLVRYLDTELKKLQDALAASNAAIQQLQAKVNP